MKTRHVWGNEETLLIRKTQCVKPHRTGKETGRRNLTLVDDTCTEITLTIWGDTAQGSEERWDGNPVIAFKSVKVRVYHGLCECGGRFLFFSAASCSCPPARALG